MTWEIDAFAYAEGYDQDSDRYSGLRGGKIISINADSTGLIVKPDIARDQLQREIKIEIPTAGNGHESPIETDGPGVGDGSTAGPRSPDAEAPEASKPRRYHGAVQLDATRVGRDAGRIAGKIQIV